MCCLNADSEHIPTGLSYAVLIWNDFVFVSVNQRNRIYYTNEILILLYASFIAQFTYWNYHDYDYICIHVYTHKHIAYEH